MNISELSLELIKFQKECINRGNPIMGYSLEEAYPGDSSTSFFLYIKADWIKDNTFEAIEFFTDVMFSVMSLEAREKIFAINIRQLIGQIEFQ